MTTKQLHKKWRIEFREGVFERDGHACVFCKATENLDAHHITDRHEMPNGGYAISNGITVCDDDHWECEKYHTGSDIKDGYHPDQLYQRIGSSKEQAIEDCLKLK